MDNFRDFPVENDHDAGAAAHDARMHDARIDEGDEDFAAEPPPSPVGQDERRMQVRAYNHWASLLGNRLFPSIDQFRSEKLAELAPYSVMLDFTAGIDDPGVVFLGSRLAEECGTDRVIQRLSDVPGRSLLSRITDHYMQILANQAPIGFEAEFVNQRGGTFLYRGILLPFSQDGETIQHIMGVINWKELADQHTTDALLHEIDRALESAVLAPALPTSISVTLPARSKPVRETSPLPAWAAAAMAPAAPDDDDADDDDGIDIAPFVGSRDLAFDLEMFADIDEQLPRPGYAPGYGDRPLDPGLAANPFVGENPFARDPVPEAAAIPQPAEPARLAPEDFAGHLALARHLAETARTAQDRTRQALYAAIGQAWDVALAAEAEPEAFARVVAEAGLTVQERAPLLPVVKLVFGANYDKTRLTEYATALGAARRLGLGAGTLADHLDATPGGLKAIIAEERRLKQSGSSAGGRRSAREGLARRLRKLPATPLAAIAPEGEEFTLVVARRMADGTVALVGEIADDTVLLERAARRLLA